MKVSLNVSGFEVHAEFADSDVEKIHKPLLEKFSKLYQQKQERVVIFLAAPPGSGKSTLAAFWEHLSERCEGLEEVQVLPFDGFHFTNAVLESCITIEKGKAVSLSSIKGAYQTFNLTELVRKLIELKGGNPKWPFYDRNLHEPIEDSISVEKNIVVVEGSYLLLEQPVWNGLDSLADFTVFVEAEPSLLQERLVNRKIRGGMEEKAALDFYKNSDANNVETVLCNSKQANLTLKLNSDGSLSF